MLHITYFLVCLCVSLHEDQKVKFEIQIGIGQLSHFHERLLPLLLCGISITRLSGSNRTKFRFRTNVLYTHTRCYSRDAIETISFLWCHMKLAKSYSNDVVSSKHSVECGPKISMVILHGQKRNNEKDVGKTKNSLFTEYSWLNIKIYVSKIFRKKSPIFG